MGLVMLEHFGEAGDAAGGQRVHRTRADAVDADLLGAQVVSQVPGTSLK